MNFLIDCEDLMITLVRAMDNARRMGIVVTAVHADAEAAGTRIRLRFQRLDGSQSNILRERLMHIRGVGHVSLADEPDTPTGRRSSRYGETVE